MILVPMDALSENVLTALIEEFVTREGAIQGEDVGMEVKVREVRRHLKEKRVVIVWDEESETTSILTKEEAGKILNDK